MINGFFFTSTAYYKVQVLVIFKYRSKQIMLEYWCFQTSKQIMLEQSSDKQQEVTQGSLTVLQNDLVVQTMNKLATKHNFVEALLGGLPNSYKDIFFLDLYWGCLLPSSYLLLASSTMSSVPCTSSNFIYY